MDTPNSGLLGQALVLTHFLFCAKTQRYLSDRHHHRTVKKEQINISRATGELSESQHGHESKVLTRPVGRQQVFMWRQSVKRPLNLGSLPWRFSHGFSNFSNLSRQIPLWTSGIFLLAVNHVSAVSVTTSTHNPIEESVRCPYVT